MPALSGSCSDDGGRASALFCRRYRIDIRERRGGLNGGAMALHSAYRSCVERRTGTLLRTSSRWRNEALRIACDEQGAWHSALCRCAWPSHGGMPPRRPVSGTVRRRVAASICGDSPLDRHRDDRHTPSVAQIQHAATACEKALSPSVVFSPPRARCSDDGRCSICRQPVNVTKMRALTDQERSLAAGRRAATLARCPISSSPASCD